MYSLSLNPDYIILDEHTFIPKDESFQEYRDYLAWVAAGNTPAPYVAPVPILTCTPFQIRAALTKQGLRAQVEAAVSASTDQNVKDAWQFAQSFTENDAFVTAMATSLNQTTDQIHALFVLANTLSA